MFENLTPEQMSMLAVGLLVAWFALQVFKLVFDLVRDYVGKRNGEEESSCSELIECLNRVDQKAQVIVEWVGDLHEWHDVTDPRTGTRVWYSSFQNSALQDTLVKVCQTLEKMTEVLRDISEGQREQKRALEAVSVQAKDHQTALARVQESLNDIKRGE